MNYSYEIRNRMIVLYINGNKLLSRPSSEASRDPFVRWFVAQAIT